MDEGWVLWQKTCMYRSNQDLAALSAGRRSIGVHVYVLLNGTDRLNEQTHKMNFIFEKTGVKSTRSFLIIPIAFDSEVTDLERGFMAINYRKRGLCL